MSAPVLAYLAALCGAAAVHGLVLEGRRAGSSRRRPAWVMAAGLLAVIGRRLAPAWPVTEDLRRRLAAAAVPARFGVGDFVAVKLGAALVAMLPAVALAPAAPGRLALVLLAASPAAGFAVPDALLARRARLRATAVAADLPEVLDLLRVALAAGMSLAAALGEVGRRHRGLFARELGAAAARMALGVPREAALGELSARCPLPAVDSLVGAARRSEEYGVPLARALAAIAADARAQRARAVHDRAARAAPKIQLVVALLLVPAAMLLLAAGMVAGFA